MKRSIQSLTGVRGIAALWVVFYHLQDAAAQDDRFSWLANLQLAREGFRGVDLFFVLSGFILMFVHRDDFEVLSIGATRSFFVARFWRVYPLNAAALLLIAAFAVMFPGFINPAVFSPAAIIQSLAIAQRWFMPDFGAINGPAWSLSVEIMGYAAFPILAFGLSRVRSAKLLLLAATLCLTILVALSIRFGFAYINVTGRVTILRMAGSFVAGCALAELFLLTKPEDRLARHAGVLATVSALLCVAVCCNGTLAALAVFPIAGLVLGLAFERGPTNGFMASKPVVWLGQISFSLYLTHNTMISLLTWWFADKQAAGAPTGQSWPLVAGYDVAVLCIVIATAAAMHYGFERPVARLSRSFRTARTLAPPATVQAELARQSKGVA